MSCNFETKNCSQRSHGVEESGVSASLPAAKRGVLAECTGSRVPRLTALQILWAG